MRVYQLLVGEGACWLPVEGVCWLPVEEVCWLLVEEVCWLPVEKVCWLPAAEEVCWLTAGEMQLKWGWNVTWEGVREREGVTSLLSVPAAGGESS